MRVRRNAVPIVLSLAVVGALVVAAVSQEKGKTDRKIVVQRDSALNGPDAKTTVQEPLILDNAPLSEAIKAVEHLKGFEGISIAVPDPDNSRKVTLRIAAGSMRFEQLIRTLADLYDRNLRVENGVWTLRKKGPMDAYTLVKPDTGTFKLSPQDKDGLLKLRTEPFVYQLGGNKEIADQLRKSAEELRKAAKDKDAESMAKTLEKQAESLEKAAKELDKSGGMPDIQSLMRDFQWFGPDGSKLHTWSWPEDGKSIDPERQKKFEEWLNSHGFEDGEGLHELKDLLPAPGKDKTTPHVLRMGGGDVGALVKSITPEQWELHKKQGHLKIGDLTEQQRKMLGVDESSTDRNFSMKIKVNDKELDIRSK